MARAGTLGQRRDGHAGAGRGGGGVAPIDAPGLGIQRIDRARHAGHEQSLADHRRLPVLGAGILERPLELQSRKVAHGQSGARLKAGVVLAHAPSVPLRGRGEIERRGRLDAQRRVERGALDAVAPDQFGIDIAQRLGLLLDGADVARDRRHLGVAQPRRHRRHRPVAQRRQNEARRVPGQDLATRGAVGGIVMAARAARGVERCAVGLSGRRRLRCRSGRCVVGMRRHLPGSRLRFGFRRLACGESRNQSRGGNNQEAFPRNGVGSYPHQ